MIVDDPEGSAHRKGVIADRFAQVVVDLMNRDGMACEARPKVQAAREAPYIELVSCSSRKRYPLAREAIAEGVRHCGIDLPLIIHREPSAIVQQILGG